MLIKFSLCKNKQQKYMEKQLVMNDESWQILNI